VPTTSTQIRSSRTSTDPRAARSREALFAAAIELVTRAASSDVSLAALAAESGLSRQAIYLHFPDRDAVLIAAAVDLLTRELIEPARERAELVAALDLAEHFDRHRTFYAAIMNGSCVGQLNRELLAVFLPVNERLAITLAGSHGAQRDRDLALFLTGGTEKLVMTWMLAADPESAKQFAARLTAVVEALTGATATTT
jgi:AcrR family transcriptional regulator